MHIERLYIKNYKIFSESTFDFNPVHNIFVGNNDSGKSTILEALEIVLSGRLNNNAFYRQLKMSHFNLTARHNYVDSIDEQIYVEPPSILIEAYFDVDSNGDLQGTNNSLGIDSPGIRFEVSIDSEYSEIYKKMLVDGEIFDIPLELYNISWTSFKGEPIIFRKLNSPRVTKIDTSKRDYSNAISRFIGTAITENLDGIDKVVLSKVYTSMKNTFNNDDIIMELNKKLLTNDVSLDGRPTSLVLKEETADSWIDNVSINVDGVPFDNLGFGTQKIMKMELNHTRSSNSESFILFEEPENNLSFSNMNKLVDKLSIGENCQTFITTHSSFIANKMNLLNLFIIENGKSASLKNLSEDTQSFFKKLPGYDTVRILLSENPILVEGPTDDLVVQRAYKDLNSKLPIDDGVDILVVDSLAFKRYCDVANLLSKKIRILTDNDGDIQSKIIDKYDGYIGNENIDFYYEKNEKLNTLEPSILEVNSLNGDTFDRFKSIIGKNNSLKSKTKEEVLSFMINNKTLWGLRVFDSIDSITYPEYIYDILK